MTCKTCTAFGEKCVQCLSKESLFQKHTQQVADIEEREIQRKKEKIRELSRNVRTIEEIMDDIYRSDDPEETRLLFEEKRKCQSLRSFL